MKRPIKAVYLLLMLVGMPAAVVATPLSLDQAIVNLLEHDKAIKIAEKQFKQAKARERQQWSQIFPKLTLAVERVHNDLKGTRRLSTTIPLSDDTSSLDLEPIDAYKLKASLSQTFYDQKVPFQLGIAKFNKLAAKHHLADTTLKQILTVSQTYWDTVLYTHHGIIFKKAIDISEQLIEESRAKQKVGIYTQADVLSTHHDLMTLKRDYATTKLKHVQSLTRLKYLIGVAHTQPITLNIVLPSPNLTIPDMSIDLKTSPRYQKAYSLYKAADTEQKLSKASPLVFSGTTQYGTANEAKVSTDDKDKDFSWVLNVSYPLFNGFNTLAIKQETKAKKEQKELELQLESQALQLEISNYIYSIKEYQAHLTEADTHQQLRQEELNITQAKFKNNQAPYSAVLIAKKQFNDAKMAWVNAVIGHEKAWASYRYATGQR